MSENKADILDQASEVAQQATDDAVARYRRLAAPEQDPDDIDPYCCDCGGEIEPGRLELLKKRCFQCQTLFENRRKFHA